MRYFVPFIGLLFTNAAYTQIADNYQPASPIPMPCYELTATNGINTPLHEDSKCIVTHPDASVYPGYEAFVYAMTNDVEIKAGEEIHFNGKMHFAANNGNAIWAHIETPDPIEMAWFYPQNSPGIAMRHEKMELGFDLPTEIEQDIAEFFDINVTGANELNPYNRHDIDITVSFYRDGVHIQDVDAFYYKEMEINTSSKHWDEVNTDYNWRVRFAPPEFGGNWTALINVKATNHTDLNNYFSFQVNDSNNPGYLEKGSYNKHLRTSYDKKSFFGVGQSLTWPVMNDNSDLDFKVNTEEADLFHTVVETFGNSGGNFCRINGWPPGHEFELEALGNYDTRQDMAWDLDRIVEYLEEEDLYMMYVVKHHEPFQFRDPLDSSWQGWEGEKWDENPYKSDRVFSFGNFAHENLNGVFEPLDFFNNPNARDLFKNYVRYVFSRWGYSTAIGAWQIWSEIDHTGDYHSSANYRSITHDFLEEIGDYVKNDLKIKQLYSTSIGTMLLDRTRMDDASLYRIPYHDFTGIHTYIEDRPATDGGIDKMRNRNVLTRFKTARHFITGHEDMDSEVNTGTNGYYPEIATKPFLFDEFGVKTNIEAHEDEVLSPHTEFIRCNDIIFHNDLWSSAMMGGMCTGLDWFAVESPSFGASNFPALMHFFSNVDFEAVNYDHFNTQQEDDGFNSHPTSIIGTAQRWPETTHDVSRTSLHRFNNHRSYKKHDKVEAITMVSEDGDQAFGWVHNRSVYYWNMQNLGNYTCYSGLATGNGYLHGPYIERPDDDDNLNSPMTINGYLDNGPNSDKAYFEVYGLEPFTQYHIEFYNTRTAAWVTTYFRTTSISGTLKIWVPKMSNSLNPDLAYKIFSNSWKSSSINTTHEIRSVKDYKFSSAARDINSLAVTIAPNPMTNGLSTLSIDSKSSYNKLRIEVYDINGRLILNEQIFSSQYLIDISNQPNGVYLVKLVIDGERIYDSKIVKM